MCRILLGDKESLCELFSSLSREEIKWRIKHVGPIDSREELGAEEERPGQCFLQINQHRCYDLA